MIRISKNVASKYVHIQRNLEPGIMLIHYDGAKVVLVYNTK